MRLIGARYNSFIMRRLLLGSAGLCSLVSIALTCAMWSRSGEVMDWLRVSALDWSAILASSRAHVGAAIVVDADRWIASKRPPVRYRNFQPADLRKKFPQQVLGFGYRADDGVYLVLFPMWALMAAALIPPAVWVQQKRARRVRRTQRQRAERRQLQADQAETDATSVA